MNSEVIVLYVKNAGMEADKKILKIACAQARLKRKMILKENRMNKKCVKECGIFSKSQHGRTLCTPLSDVTTQFLSGGRLNTSGRVQCHKNRDAVPDSNASHRQNLLPRFEIVFSEQEKDNQCSLNKSSSQHSSLTASHFHMGEEISQPCTNADNPDNGQGIN